MKAIKLAAIIGLIGLAASGIALSRPRNQQLHVMEGDYPIYNDLETITSASDLVIRGTVQEVLSAKRIIPDNIPLSQMPLHKSRNIGFLTTGMQVQVEEVLRGDLGLAGTEIVVNQMGGSLGPQIYTMKNQPLSKKDQELLLFLRETGEDTYAIIGGQQGRYLIQAEEIRAIAQDKESLNLPVVRSLNGAAFVRAKQSLQNPNDQMH